ncbi:MAG: hypothetical protein OXJ52_05815 [Oligoflexia bacterium]|nr:hypothetical protein [Oligoflexia bacterium]
MPSSQVFEKCATLKFQTISILFSSKKLWRALKNSACPATSVLNKNLLYRLRASKKYKG